MGEARLPREHAARAIVGRAFRQELRSLDALIRLCLRIIGSGSITITNKRGLNRPTVHVAMGLCVKACKTARAIRMLAAAGFPEDAMILTRSLLETSVALLFILQWKSKVRAQMYLAHISVRTKTAFNGWKQTPGLKRRVTKKMMAQVDQAIQESQHLLGGAIIASLKAGYSGMNLEQTIAALRGQKTYQVFYRYASSFAHASDLSEHVAFAPDGTPILKLTPGAAPTIRQALAMAHGLLWTTITRLDTRLGLGHAQDLATHRPPR